ncbi:MAG: hypothetical protein J6U63_04010 [Clostridia bacterium]|nr:hypothetical protein [Clostridia bacterium]
MRSVWKNDQPAHGLIHYFKGPRCWNDDELRAFNQGKILAEELVTLDCGLMDLEEIDEREALAPIGAGCQVICAVYSPGKAPNEALRRGGVFQFCGYDLVEAATSVSAITNCGAAWGKALEYSLLNEIGLFSTYPQAKQNQRTLREQYPDEAHADCEIIELWRRIET